MKPRHTFNIKSTGFDYTKVRKIEQQTEEKKEAPPNFNFNVNSNEMVTVSRPRLKKNRFQKD